MENHMTVEEITASLRTLLSTMPENQRITAINQLRGTLHEFSPFKDEPIDCVIWMKTKEIKANDYNPNNVAPTENALLNTSLMQDGFTHPIVATHDTSTEKLVIIDGFHRFEISRKAGELNKRLKGYVPVVLMPKASNDKNHRMAATIRHNRARGRHQINAMAEIVRELSQLGWDDAKIGIELGMDADEVLRLKQVCGLFELFNNRQFSQAWTVK
ncbi:MAG TPA: ParB/RepB/Spo0J family partition protein [Buttiauxella sp.]|nr:ParB/RepB/Spo0J family partition protein [Buttiauxella sp.]